MMSREMKHSGIEWIGEIPKEWKVAKLKQLGSYINGYAFKPEDWSDSGKPIIRIQDLTGSFSNPNYFSGTIDNRYLITKGDILVSWAATLDAFIWSNEDGWLNQHIFKAVPDSCMNSRFFYWLIKVAMDNMNNDNKHGIVMQHVTVGLFGNFLVGVPSYSEQQKIANYLDKVCGEVDEMIALQEQMIEELKAYKQSVITEAVTKGLNPNVPMKDSGINWIGEIPEHWNLIHFFKTNWIRARLGWKGLKADEYTETGYPFLSAFNIINDKLVWEDLNFINQERYDESPEIKLSIGDLLLVKDGAGIGKCAVVDELPFGEATVNSSLAVVSPNRVIVDTHFQYYYFKSAIFQNTIWLLKIGMGVPHLTQENMRDIIIPNPPLSEQQFIASYLDTKCAEIDDLIALKQTKIEELKEYKKSVIYEYVTGKKEVV